LVTDRYLDPILVRKRELWSVPGAPDPGFGPRPAPARRGTLRAALNRGHVAVVAEVKPRSPSKGALLALDRAVPTARRYAAAGAAAVSVLADEEFFGGSPALVAAVAGDPEVTVPVLFKDFVVDVRQVELAHRTGATGVLVIVRALGDAELADVTQAARDLGLDPLHECFDERDLERAFALDADLVGVNNRDLQTFAVDLARSARLRRLIPEGVVTVSESGLSSTADVRRVAEQGFHACLVGEALLGSTDLEAQLRSMGSVPRPEVVAP
jgi:indole-3-glycerol phosphate synthase